MRKSKKFILLLCLLVACHGGYIYGGSYDITDPVYKIPVEVVPVNGIVKFKSGLCRRSVGNIFNIVDIEIGDAITDGTRLIVDETCSITIDFESSEPLVIGGEHGKYDVIFNVQKG